MKKIDAHQGRSLKDRHNHAHKAALADIAAAKVIFECVVCGINMVMTIRQWRYTLKQILRFAPL